MTGPRPAASRHGDIDPSADHRYVAATPSPRLFMSWERTLSAATSPGGAREDVGRTRARRMKELERGRVQGARAPFGRDPSGADRAGPHPVEIEVEAARGPS